MNTALGINHGGLCGAIYSCSNGNVEKHICSFKYMTIQPLHMDINSEVFYVNICGFILQEQRTPHPRGAFPERHTSSAFGASFPERCIFWPPFHPVIPLPIHECAETPLILLPVSKWTSNSDSSYRKTYMHGKLGLKTAF